jgi:putative quorum-sensing-regulated virulence factor
MTDTIGFGKYAKTPLADVPEGYLLWLLDQQGKLCETIQEELARRERAAEASMSWIERIISVGYRELSKRHHPDAGGTNAEMQGVNSAYEVLRAGIERAKRQQQEQQEQEEARP